MKCRKCGNEVDIGEVYCQKCGTAIQIVPEYNPLADEIESAIDHIEDDEEETARQELRRRKRARLKRKRRIRWAILAAVVVLLAIVINSAISIYTDYREENSFEYQYQLGKQYMSEGEYGAALECYTKALSFDRDNVSVRVEMADIYSTLGNYNRTVELLLEAVNLDPKPSYYEKLMKACEYTGNSELMNKILRENQGNAIGDMMQEYKVGDVRVSIPGGEYQDYLTLTLAVQQADATIYYTLDQSAPTEGSTVYTEPIVLDSTGTFTLRAVAYNEFHLSGQELQETYKIELVIPDAPVISPQNGRYSYGERITVEVPTGATGYFTVDGSVPTQESAYIYTDPVEMPIGNTVFAAMIIDKYGVQSNVSKRNYECNIDRPFQYDAAVIKLKSYLVEVGMMSDLSGNRGNGEKITLESKQLSMISDQECYVFVLRRTVNGESEVISDKVYAVTTKDGRVYPLTRTEGGYQFIEPVPEEAPGETAAQ